VYFNPVSALHTFFDHVFCYLVYILFSLTIYKQQTSGFTLNVITHSQKQ